MLTFLPGPIRGAIAFILLAIITIAVALFVLIAALISMLPIQSLRNSIAILLHKLPEYWTHILNVIIILVTKTHWNIHGLKQLKNNGRYLMIANHRSWVDILVLQRVFSKKIPGLRFFMKKELIWQLPLIGFAFKLMGHLSMQRYSADFLEKHPELKGKDIEATRKACARFKDNPVTIINFIEGGRFTEEKHRAQKSPYKFLLKPKAGGIAFVLAALENQLENIIDVTIIYPKMQISFWQFLCGKINQITVFIHCISIKKELLGDYQNDAEFRKFFQFWLNELWVEKDKFIINKLHEL